MSVAESSKPQFSIAEARQIVKDLFAPSPAIYWTDFLLSIGVGIVGFTVLHRGLLPAAWRWAYAPLFFLTVVTFYRAVLFTHELVHLRDESFRVFRIAWNVLCGIPFLVPSFTYYTHLAHHARKHYGTRDDGEYLPLGCTAPWHIVWYVGQSVFVPVLGVLRFLVLTPLSWFSPRFRRWVFQHASSMIIDPAYVRPLPTRIEARLWRMQELASFAYLVGIVVLIAVGVLDWWFVVLAYLVAVSIITLNAIRTVGAHRYHNSGEHEMTFIEQLLDSLNYPRRPWFAELWAPVGLRFHALHHLFPSMPYHALAEAHRRLMAQLPADSLYRQTESPGLLSAWRQIWRDAAASVAAGRDSSAAR